MRRALDSYLLRILPAALGTLEVLRQVLDLIERV
jgi:hypothetical protein